MINKKIKKAPVNIQSTAKDGQASGFANGKCMAKI